MLNFSDQWAYSHIQLDLAWEAMESMDLSSTPIRIGVIDSGIDASHLELLNVNSNDSDTYGNNTVRGATVDSYGHGTKVAGIIKGVADNVELISLKVSEGDVAKSSDVYEALISLDSSIPIINFSISWKNSQGASLSTNYDRVIEEALKGYNGLIVCAAGNSGAGIGIGSDIDNDTNYDYYPVQHDIPNMIVVGASTRSDGVRSDSNYGDTHVDVFAPGEDLYTTTNSGGYTDTEGMTSMATPFVTGLAAMLLMVNDRLTPEMIIDIITSTVDTEDSDNPNNGNNIGDLVDACSSNGRINAYEAVLMAETYPTCDHDGDFRYGQNNASTHKVICNNCDEVIETVAHEGYNTNYGSSGHQFYCTVCRYSAMRDHDIYISAIYNDVYTIKCHACSYVKNCSCSREYEADGNTGHNVTCTDCSYSLVESHTYEQTGKYDSSGHEIECTYCYYSEYVDHDLYMYSAETEDYTVKCRDCDYSVRCTQCPECYGNSDDGHWVDSLDGCYSFFEPHTYTYTDTGNGTHTVTCADCGYTYTAPHLLYRSESETENAFAHIIGCTICDYESTESHTWVSSGLVYRCTVCGMISDAIPGIMSLPDPELEAYLASLSDEELEEFIASLPEDQAARVTALLPSDDEFLTE